ncbi:MAG TPA: helix-turn-helix domain-containing protein [Candidatus Dormibacteraeota bacterium]|nr:helix-turn-helix domain-containing protein [Candidatus Dormibacteraeota bacterium]
MAPPARSGPHTTDLIAPSASPPRPAGAWPLPPELTERLLSQVDRMADTLARRLSAEIEMPEGFRSVTYLRAVVQACRDGIRALLLQLHDQRRQQTAELARLGRAGERQAEMGVPLEVLLSAYRLAARVVWQEVIGEAARERELEPATVLAVSEQVLDYLDKISGAVGRAYLETRERLMRQRDRERDRVLQRLLAGDVAGTDLRRLAAALDLDLTPPYRVLACWVIPGIDADPLLASAWRRAGALVAGDDPGTWIALVRGDADVEQLARTAAEAIGRAHAGGDGGIPLRIGAGPVAARLEDVADAARRARRALSAGTRLSPDVLVHDDAETGVFSLLAADPEELRAHVRQVLGPIMQGSTSRSAMLLGTLEALVGARGVSEAASRLGIHRHTVVYRLQRLRDLLGVDIDDPSQRHRLWLALQAARLLQ